jgi:hypothetical protein
MCIPAVTREGIEYVVAAQVSTKLQRSFSIKISILPLACLVPEEQRIIVGLPIIDHKLLHNLQNGYLNDK